MISTQDNDISVPSLFPYRDSRIIVSNSRLSHVHSVPGCISGRGDRAGVLDYLPHKKEENDVIHRAPSLLGGEVIC
jgi:hypothetical protein